MKLITLITGLVTLATYTTALPAEEGATCTTTIRTNAPFNVGPTSTHYLTTVTSTAEVDCGGCDLVVTKWNFGHGPVAVFTTTVTVPTSTAKAYACAYGS